jgi:hypothetical protein
MRLLSAILPVASSERTEELRAVKVVSEVSPFASGIRNAAM